MHPGERFNSFSHLAGAILAAAGLVLLMVLATPAGDPVRIVSFGLYGTTLVLVYLASTLYHSTRGRAKAVFHKLDRAAIYLLVAGTYTPFCLVALPPAWGWSLLGTVWGLAAAGVAMGFLPGRMWRLAAGGLYPVMGWLGIAASKPLLGSLAPGGFGWLLAGGVAYTLGAAVLSWRSLPRNHEVWHLLALGGSACHFLALLLYVA